MKTSHLAKFESYVATMSSFDKCHAVKLVACSQAPGHRNLFLFPPPVSAPRVFFISQHHQRKRTAVQSMQFTLSCNVCAFWDWSCVFHIFVFGTSVSVFARYRIPGHNWFVVFVQFYSFNLTAAVWMNWTVWRIFFIFKDCPIIFRTFITSIFAVFTVPYPYFLFYFKFKNI